MNTTNTCGPNAQIIFEGVKSSWRSRTQFEISFARHENLLTETWEIIAFNPSLSIFAERLYISYKIAKTKINVAPTTLDENIFRSRVIEYLFDRIDAPGNNFKFALDRLLNYLHQIYFGF